MQGTLANEHGELIYRRVRLLPFDAARANEDSALTAARSERRLEGAPSIQARSRSRKQHTLAPAPRKPLSAFGRFFKVIITLLIGQ